ncbi:MAG: type II 3-dehydroquinate dehydratase [Myxococcales bacterium]|nr:MAG: type II 3-dehydroquinate dehydratase [Myxococcales bacterium]
MAAQSSLKILVLHGPNLNLLGSREPEIYGRETLKTIDAQLKTIAKQFKVSLTCKQSNHEGVLIDLIQQAPKQFAGLLINLGAFTHTSLALADALSAVALPYVEVHLSNIFSREALRHDSLTAVNSVGFVAGFASNSYPLGLRGLIDYLKAPNRK